MQMQPRVRPQGFHDLQLIPLSPLTFVLCLPPLRHSQFGIGWDGRTCLEPCGSFTWTRAGPNEIWGTNCATCADLALNCDGSSSSNSQLGVWCGIQHPITGSNPISGVRGSTEWACGYTTSWSDTYDDHQTCAPALWCNPLGYYCTACNSIECNFGSTCDSQAEFNLVETTVPNADIAHRD